ncbi:MAG: hypothetical protein IAE80_01410 [Anaerolinea sp.]|nr:hypothetical protein [Anaerolinea sp.]
MNLLPKIQAALDVPTTRRTRSTLQLARMAAALLIVIVATVGVYAFYQEIVGGDPGLDAMSAENRIVYFGMTQPIIGEASEAYNIQVTLDYAFADANRITVAYTVTGEAPASEGLTVFSNPSLTDDQSNQYIWLMLGSSASNSEATPDAEARVSFTQTMVSHFDSSILRSAPETLNLSLRIEAAYANNDIRADFDPYAMLMAGETTFTFELPFNPGRVLSEPQTAMSGDLPLTLLQAVVAPSLTRLDVCFDEPVSIDQNWVAFGSITIGGEIVVPESSFAISGMDGLRMNEDDVCHAIIVPYALHVEQGEWTVTINALRGWADNETLARLLTEDYGVEASASPDGGLEITTVPDGVDVDAAIAAINAEHGVSINGDWTFTFTLP